MLVTLSLIAAIRVVAQMPSNIVDTLDKKSQLSGSIKNKAVSQGSFSHATSRGNIYTLADDNMPCLVPNMNHVVPMPGSIQKVPESRMPNAIPRRQIIPEQKNHKNPQPK